MCLYIMNRGVLCNRISNSINNCNNNRSLGLGKGNNKEWFMLDHRKNLFLLPIFIRVILLSRGLSGLPIPWPIISRRLFKVCISEVIRDAMFAFLIKNNDTDEKMEDYFFYDFLVLYYGEFIVIYLSDELY